MNIPETLLHTMKTLGGVTRSEIAALHPELNQNSTSAALSKMADSNPHIHKETDSAGVLRYVYDETRSHPVVRKPTRRTQVTLLKGGQLCERIARAVEMAKGKALSLHVINELLPDLSFRQVQGNQTHVMRKFPHVHRKGPKGGPLFYWDTSSENPMYLEGIHEGLHLKSHKAAAKPLADPVHKTIATRDYRVNIDPEISAEMFRTAIRTVNTFIQRAEGVKLRIEDGKLKASRMVVEDF